MEIFIKKYEGDTYIAYK